MIVLLKMRIVLENLSRSYSRSFFFSICGPRPEEGQEDMKDREDSVFWYGDIKQKGGTLCT